LRPCLDVTVGARPPIRIAFEITFGLGAQWHHPQYSRRRHSGNPHRLLPRQGKRKCEKVTLIERATKELDLPSRIVLPRGIPIARRGPLVFVTATMRDVAAYSRCFRDAGGG